LLEAHGTGLKETCEVLNIPFDYHVGVTLVQNVERARWRRAAEASAGVGAATNPADLEPAWADALTRTAQEAKEMHFRMNAARMYARARASRG
jgi:hypothetical protein